MDPSDPGWEEHMQRTFGDKPPIPPPITQRDLFIAAAMCGLLSGTIDERLRTPEDANAVYDGYVCKTAVALADKMIAHLKDKGKK